MSARKALRARQARRIARYRAGLIVIAALSEGWNPPDLIKRYGQEGMDEIVDQLGEIAEWLLSTGHPDGTSHGRTTR